MGKFIASFESWLHWCQYPDYYILLQIWKVFPWSVLEKVKTSPYILLYTCMGMDNYLRLWKLKFESWTASTCQHSLNNTKKCTYWPKIVYHNEYYFFCCLLTEDKTHKQKASDKTIIFKDTAFAVYVNSEENLTKKLNINLSIPFTILWHIYACDYGILNSLINQVCIAKFITKVSWSRQ